jgi:hypothetical protein
VIALSSIFETYKRKYADKYVDNITDNYIARPVRDSARIIMENQNVLDNTTPSTSAAYAEKLKKEDGIFINILCVRALCAVPACIPIIYVLDNLSNYDICGGAIALSVVGITKKIRTDIMNGAGPNDTLTKMIKRGYYDKTVNIIVDPKCIRTKIVVSRVGLLLGIIELPCYLVLLPLYSRTSTPYSARKWVCHGSIMITLIVGFILAM